jgi:preprotein translocase subunit SecG
MFAFLGFLHVVVCVLLIVSVLLQSGKGGGLASAFGGAGTQAVFGGRGAATFLSRATSVLAIMFMLTSLTMTVTGGNRARRSALAEQAEREGVAAPFTPAAPPGATDEGAQPMTGTLPDAAGQGQGQGAPQGAAPGTQPGTTPQGGTGEAVPQGVPPQGQGTQPNAGQGAQTPPAGEPAPQTAPGGGGN